MRNRLLFERQKENVCLFNEEGKVKKVLDSRLFVFPLVSLTQPVPVGGDRALFCFSLAQKTGRLSLRPSIHTVDKISTGDT